MIRAFWEWIGRRVVKPGMWAHAVHGRRYDFYLNGQWIYSFEWGPKGVQQYVIGAGQPPP